MVNKREKGILLAIIVIVLFFGISIFRQTASSDSGLQSREPVIDNSRKITVSDVEQYYIAFDEQSYLNNGIDSSNLTHGRLNQYTLKYFAFLQDMFSETEDFNEHLEEVRRYLYSILSLEDAEKMFELYKKYAEYQLGLTAEASKWGTPTTADDAIDYLHRLQNYRRQHFGSEVADDLFGAEIKSREYQIRRSAIVNNPDLYAADKLRLIQDLNETMWKEDALIVEDTIREYIKYRELLKIYSKDMESMSEDEQQETVRTIRSSVFTPEIVERLEDADMEISSIQTIENQYEQLRSEILQDESLSDEEKSQKIDTLREHHFGSAATTMEKRELLRNK